MNKYLFIILFIAVFASCEKNIDLQPTNQESLLVVDGSIETGKYPQLVLSSSINFSATIGWNQLANSFVHGADVTLSDSVSSQKLLEYSIPLGAGYNAYYYGEDTTNPNALKGIVGRTYTLTIKYNNQTYTSVTTIPLPTFRIDSIWYKPIPIKEDSDKVFLMGRFTDDKGFGSYFRNFTKVNTKSVFLSARNSVGNDQVIDGTTFIAQINRGVDRNDDSTDNKGMYTKGDTVIVKFCNIDKDVYTFWNTWEFSANAIGNPFSNPGKVINNVNNGALGAFCGYNPQYKSIIIPK